MKKAKQTFEKMTKYSIRKLSVGVGPVAIGVFLLGGSLLGARPVKADQVTLPAHVHLGYVTEEELSISSIRRRKQLSRFFLKQEVRKSLFLG